MDDLRERALTFALRSVFVGTASWLTVAIESKLVPVALYVLGISVLGIYLSRGTSRHTNPRLSLGMREVAVTLVFSGFYALIALLLSGGLK